MEFSTLILITVFAPLLGAALTGPFVRLVPDRYAHIVTCGLMLTSAIGAALVFREVNFNGQDGIVRLMTWLESGDFYADWSLRVDVLTSVMLVVVTWVSTVVHFYSIGYMHHDPHQPRFMCYLSLFTFAMLMLVTADNFIQLFFGWEGVGLCSYLLIGFWFKKESANRASMKAFIVNRVGDFGFALGIMAVFLVFGTVSFEQVFQGVVEKAGLDFEFLGMTLPIMDVICLLLFVGAMGKSAQLLLHTWLPDAMEGPTPVSALIHAATMVTAGVFMVARCSPMFEYAPTALFIVTLVGAATAIFAATVGMVQNDIKRIIAYSTCSQLGYMFFACGVSAYAAGIFHLMTHAFFKALLFLGAGSVIHAMSNEQDIRNMGGIWKKIPITYALFWIGSLALAGLPLFAGYYSKDIILESAFADHSLQGNIAFWLGALAALLTAFYSWRLIFLTFHGKPRASHEVMHHIHESPKSMLLPLIPLVLGALFAGYIGMEILKMVDGHGEFWRGSIVVLEKNNTLEAAHHVPEWVPLLPVAVGLTGIFVAWLVYLRKPGTAAKVASMFRPIYTLFLNKYYFDELYDAIFVRPAKRLGAFLSRVVDAGGIDRFGPNGSAFVSQAVGRFTSRLQTGYIYHYATAMLLGLLLLISWLWAHVKGVL